MNDKMMIMHSRRFVRGSKVLFPLHRGKSQLYNVGHHGCYCSFVQRCKLKFVVLIVFDRQK